MENLIDDLNLLQSLPIDERKVTSLIIIEGSFFTSFIVNFFHTQLHLILPLSYFDLSFTSRVDSPKLTQAYLFNEWRGI